MEKHYVDKACSTHENSGKCIQNFSRDKLEGEKNHLQVLAVNWKIILKLTSAK
jgi:hypothetical protein